MKLLQEDGSWIIEGSIEQRVVVGTRRKHDVLEDVYFRGVVPITVTVKGGPAYNAMRVIEGAETKFTLKVPKKPFEVAVNKYNHILAHDVLVNQSCIPRSSKPSARSCSTSD